MTVLSELTNQIMYTIMTFMLRHDMSTRKTLTFRTLYSCLQLVSTKPIVDKQFISNCCFFVNFSEILDRSILRPCRAFESQIFSQNFPPGLLRTSTQAGSVVLDCTFSLDSGYIVYNSA